MSLKHRRDWLKRFGHRVKRSPTDLRTLYEFLSKRAPISGMIEIGCYHGGTLYTFADHVDKKSIVIGVDLFGRDRETRKGKTTRVIKQLSSEGHNVYMVQGDSRKVVGKVRGLLGPRKVGLLHIDGGHSYEVAKADFNNYSPLVEAGGVVLLHDITNDNTQVPKVWRELQAKYGDKAVQLTHIEGEGSGAILL